MKKYSKYLVVPAMLMLFSTSCTDLTEELKGEITEDIQVAGVGATESLLVPSGQGVLEGAYKGLRDAGTAYHSAYYSVQEITSDEMCIAAKGGDWFDGGILIDLHKHTYKPTHGFINNTWNGCYNAINTCNELISKGGIDAGQTAQMRALRAYHYLRLVDMFGNVKLITTPGKDEKQSTRVEVYNFIESELLAALNIPAVTAGMTVVSPLGTANNPYVINTFGALGILSKLYLNAEVYAGKKEYEKAAIAAGYIIDKGPYKICSTGCKVKNLGRRPAVTTDPADLEGFPAVFAPNNMNNPEHIFSVYYDEAIAGGMNFSQMNLHYSSQFTWNFDSQPWNGYATLEEFYNSFADNDLRKKASFIAGPQLDFGGSAVLDYASDDGDLQLSYNPKINELSPNSLREAGARPGKFSYKQFGRNDMDNDYPIVRLGEIYLIRGEALARAAGDWSKALPDVNVIRARAAAGAMSTVDANSFLAERGREMFAESVRRTDLIRFGQYNKAWWEKPVSQAFVNLFPIPNDQVQASGGTLKQNPGY